MPDRSPGNDDQPSHHWSAQRDDARETIVRIFALARMGATAENIAPEDVMLSVAELLAAATEVGALPPDGTCFFLSASAPDSTDLESGRATVQGWALAERFASVRVAVGGLAEARQEDDPQHFKEL